MTVSGFYRIRGPAMEPFDGYRSNLMCIGNVMSSPSSRTIIVFMSLEFPKANFSHFRAEMVFLEILFTFPQASNHRIHSIKPKN